RHWTLLFMPQVRRVLQLVLLADLRCHFAPEEMCRGLSVTTKCILFSTQWTSAVFRIVPHFVMEGTSNRWARTASHARQLHLPVSRNDRQHSWVYTIREAELLFVLVSQRDVVQHERVHGRHPCASRVRAVERNRSPLRDFCVHRGQSMRVRHESRHLR